MNVLKNVANTVNNYSFSSVRYCCSKNSRNYFSCTSNESDEKPGCLEGIRVLDFTRVLAGPFSSMLLSDMGAEIIKVESADGVGDETRKWGPPFAGNTKETSYFLSVNRNKKSIVINLKKVKNLYDTESRRKLFLK